MDLTQATVAELNAELIRKTAGEEALDLLFKLPAYVDDETLKEAYEILVARMRREVRGISMNTIQQLLIERIVINYIVLKWREAKPLGDDQGFAHAGVVKDFNTFWLSMTSEFNSLLVKHRKSDSEEILVQVRMAVEDALSRIEDTHIRAQLIEGFVETFRTHGIAV